MVTTRAQRQKLEADARNQAQDMTSPEPTSAEPPVFNMFTPKMGRLLTPSAKKTLKKVTKKAGESSFQIGASFVGLFLSVFCAYLSWTMKGDKDSQTLTTVLCLVVGVDMMSSILYYMDQAPESLVLFTEAASNAFQLFLFLSQVGSTENGIVLFVAGASVVVFAMQLRMKHNPTWWSRFAVYAPLFFNFALNWNSLETNVRLRIFATLVDVSLVLDIFDLPDSLSDVALCEGLLISLRSLGIYFLVSHSILRANGATYFGFEQAVFKGLPKGQSAAASTGGAVPSPPVSDTATNSSATN